ncbi:hypothetical protein F4859DRAFT_494026 [Xylaria cf. heliscus]|nr:hypothetical protein F4859DRAFT_494026 [Xylaria cf. heliscus]
MKAINKKDDLKFPQEHVFLIDCSGSHDAQSEAAYYSGAPIASPDTIAVVTSPNEGLRQWEDSTTTATFDNAGSGHQTGFRVTLGPRPSNGKIAGNASNTYNTSFACYAQAPRFLYTHEDRNCSSVYDCSHADRVVESSTSILPTSSRLTTELTSSIKTTPASSTIAPSTQSLLPGATDAMSPPQPHSSHSQTKVAVGIGVGVTLGTIILAVASLSILRKYWNRRRLSSNLLDAISNIMEPKLPQREGKDIHEAGSKAIPAEMPGCNVHVHELEAKPRAARMIKRPEDWTSV